MMPRAIRALIGRHWQGSAFTLLFLLCLLVSTERGTSPASGSVGETAQAAPGAGAAPIRRHLPVQNGVYYGLIAGISGSMLYLSTQLHVYALPLRSTNIVWLDGRRVRSQILRPGAEAKVIVDHGALRAIYATADENAVEPTAVGGPTPSGGDPAVRPAGTLWVPLAGVAASEQSTNARAAPWPLFQHDTQHTGQGTAAPAQRPTLIWATRIPGRFRIFPSFGLVIDAEGTIYVASEDGNLSAINPDGSRRWTFAVRGLIGGTPALGPDGTIYVGAASVACFNSMFARPAGTLSAIAPDGVQKWSVRVGGSICGLVVGSDGTLYFSVSSGANGSVVAVHADGTEEWSSAVGGPAVTGPAVGPDGTVYACTTPATYGPVVLSAFSPGGMRKWAIPLAGRCFASPMIGADGTIYVPTTSLEAINADGTIRWSIGPFLGGVTDLAAGPDGTIYATSYEGSDCNGGTSGVLTAFNPRTGAIRWRFSADSSTHNGIMVSNGGYISAPAVGRDGTIILGATDRYFYALRPDGAVRWSYPASTETDCGDPFVSPAIGWDGTVYVGANRTSGSNYVLYAFGKTHVLNK